MISSDFSNRIAELRDKLGSELLLLAHHYQHDSVVQHADQLGDSLELARRVTDSSARYIVFCGVYFMAESAAILSRKDQSACIPEHEADCSMSEMAPAWLVQAALERLHDAGLDPLPLAYVNSQAAVKAICGRHGGAICTSANASTMLRWALGSGRPVLFLPDQHLAVNTANALGLPQAERHLLRIRSHGADLDTKAASAAKLLVWPGCCSVHVKNSIDHMRQIRQQEPQAKIVVHPESPPAVVDAADSSGSTSHIIRYCQNAPSGSTIHIGTEINLVERLANEYEPDKHIRPLVVSACANMAKVSEEKLLENLQAIADGQAHRFTVEVDENIAAPARTALTRMLDVCS